MNLDVILQIFNCPVNRAKLKILIKPMSYHRKDMFLEDSKASLFIV